MSFGTAACPPLSLHTQAPCPHVRSFLMKLICINDSNQSPPHWVQWGSANGGSWQEVTPGRGRGWGISASLSSLMTAVSCILFYFDFHSHHSNMAVILIVVSWATKQSPGSIQNRFPRGSGSSHLGQELKNQAYWSQKPTALLGIHMQLNTSFVQNGLPNGCLHSHWLGLWRANKGGRTLWPSGYGDPCLKSQMHVVSSGFLACVNGSWTSSSIVSQIKVK